MSITALAWESVRSGESSVASSLKWAPWLKGASHPHATDRSRTAQLHDPTLALIDTLGSFATESLTQGCVPHVL